MSAYIKNRSISISPSKYIFFWCSATLQPFKIWFVVSCLLPCNSAPACKHCLQRSDADFPYWRRLVCDSRVSEQELSRNISVPFFIIVQPRNRKTVQTPFNRDCFLCFTLQNQTQPILLLKYSFDWTKLEQKSWIFVNNFNSCLMV